MATIKSYTDINQSRKLTEILPIESADYFHAPDVNIVVTESYITDCGGERCIPAYHGAVPCWSLSSLLSVLPKTINHETLFIETSPALWHIGYRNIYTARTDNPVDACYELILMLHELNLL
jgi:hypothetical protein